MSIYRFNHNFSDSINPLCTCSLDIDSTVHYFLHCDYYNSARISLLNDLNSVDRNLLILSDLSLVKVLLYGGPQLGTSVSAGNGWFWQQNVMQDRKSSITQSKLMIFWWNKKFLKAYDLLLLSPEKKKLNLILGMASAGLVFAQIGS